MATSKKKKETADKDKPVTVRLTLKGALKPLYDRWKAANKSRAAKVPDWANTPELKEQYRSLYSQAVKAAPDAGANPPSEKEVYEAVVSFWQK